MLYNLRFLYTPYQCLCRTGTFKIQLAAVDIACCMFPSLSVALSIVLFEQHTLGYLMELATNACNVYEEARQLRVLRNQQILEELGLGRREQLATTAQVPTESRRPNPRAVQLPTRRSKRQQGQSSVLDGVDVAIVVKKIGTRVSH